LVQIGKVGNILIQFVGVDGSFLVMGMEIFVSWNLEYESVLYGE
jgi:hypothetical protein